MLFVLNNFIKILLNAKSIKLKSDFLSEQASILIFVKFKLKNLTSLLVD